MMMFLPYIFLAAGFGVLPILLAIALIAGLVKFAGWTVASLLFVDELRESLARRVSEQLKIVQALGKRSQNRPTGKIATA